MEMIEKNQTWTLVDTPINKHIIGVKWVFQTKLNADSSLNKLKARLIVKGYAQIYDIDYWDIFSLVAILDIIRLLLAFSAQKMWKIHRLDVQSTFLNEILQEEILVEQPYGFKLKNKEGQVYLLKNALYELKQALRA